MKEIKPDSVTYQIKSVIGQGLSSTVYKAVRRDSQGHSEQVVALKILRSGTAVPWLRREFGALSRVRSPHCVRVLAWENLPDGCALVLEWIDGVSLLELARRVTLDEALIEEIIYQVQEGLKALSEEGLHHGDLSPANILIDRTGLVRIVDFGSVAHDPGEIVGTPAYIAPEVWSGHGGSIAADLFSLGLIRHDLRNSFTGVPECVQEAKDRAMRLAVNSGEGWFSREPAARNFLELRGSRIAKDAISVAVDRALQEREQRIETLVVPVSAGNVERAKPTKRFMWSAAAVALIFAFPGFTDTPASSEIQGPRSTLEFRAHNWMEVRVNGVPTGFAPVKIQGLRPGYHRIAWRTAHRSGQAKIKLEPGSKLRLTEADLEAMRSTGKD